MPLKVTQRKQKTPLKSAKKRHSKQKSKDQTKAIEDATTLLSDKGINYEALTAEYDTNGSISAESYAALEKAGFPASVVNAYIAGVEATQK